jgi:Holliday junction resolvasome RuvABC endonuclease subunit
LLTALAGSAEYENLGIDPGIHGGHAIVEINDGAAPQLRDAIDIPVAGAGAKERVDPIAIRVWVDEHRPQHVLIERAQAMPKQGSSNGFKYGRTVGAIEAVIACCGIPMTIIEPTVWKKFHRVCGGDKEGGGSAPCSCSSVRMRCSHARKTTVAPKRR